MTPILNESVNATSQVASGVFQLNDGWTTALFALGVVALVALVFIAWGPGNG